MRSSNFTVRHRLLVWPWFVLVAVASACIAGPTTRPAVIRIGMTVEDLDRSIDFFTRVLDFQECSIGEYHGEEYEKITGVFGLRCRTARLRLGSEEIELTEYLASPGRLVPRDSRSNDLWFQHIAIVTADIDAAYARLRAHKVRHVSTGPQTLPKSNPNAADIRAFYFHDPDGHVLETIQFPTGKGDPRWQGGKTLFQGIDHTAIVVADTQRSLAFYCDVLGLSLAGHSENYGPEQAHLNNVPAAHLRITALRAPAGGPGIELLEYLAPRTGRLFPTDSRPNDVFHWQVTLSGPGASAPALIRDPDHHAVFVIPPVHTETASQSHALP